MRNFYFEYRLTPRDYRIVSYFNNFCIRRFQGIFVVVAWVVSFLAFLLEMIGVWDLTRVTHICCLVVSVCVPMLVLDVELKIGAFRRDHCGKNAVLRKMIFTEEGIRQVNQGDSESNFMKWDDLMKVFEVKELFLFYLDARRVTVLPKSAVPAEKLKPLREMIREKIGQYYVRRDGKNSK